MLKITVNLTPLKQALSDLQKEQLPFAEALALTRLAQGVRDAERKEEEKTFDTPTPFTVNSITMKSATKANPVARVYAKDIASHYLEPYVFGGNRSLWSAKGEKAGMLTPKAQRVNAFGNLTKNALATLKGNRNVFIGEVKLKSGEAIRGVWMRQARQPRPQGAPRRARGTAPKPKGPLKLLIRFADTTPVPRRLPFFETANAYVRANAEREFHKALAEAMRTATRK
ncbi:hypothetical protein [Sphingomonas bacterium]|uniref:hypothetical protein n=1 Tax=Sphingomonas bacterium TaxID=1895847 RepID=UPI0015774A8E|nr:hypothetical protein [Sphingomonas bacterium]